jgi:hypothetical protein
MERECRIEDRKEDSMQSIDEKYKEDCDLDRY